MTPAERQAAYRLRKGSTPGAIGRPVTQPCGTVAAYKRHQRRQEPPCQPCRDAWAAWQRERYRARKGG